MTGHTGFKGSWLSVWLKELGADVVGYALEPRTPDDNFVVSKLADKLSSETGDIRDYNRLKGVFDKYQPEIVFHLAAQPIVRHSYAEPKLTYDTNIGGTVNLLECCRLTDSVKVIVNVTSDKCYENKEWVWGYREVDPLGGKDPYSSSKACSELVTATYHDLLHSCKSSCKSAATARAGNVIGGGDWQQDRILPDCFRALRNNEPLRVRNPKSIRPWQFVLEPLRGYLMLASAMWQGGTRFDGAWNFAPTRDSCITVEELVTRTFRYFPARYQLPPQCVEQPLPESNVLLLDSSKAASLLGWKPALCVDDAIWYTVNWYKSNKPDYALCVHQIRDYCEVAGYER